MEYATELISRQIVAATRATKYSVYECPRPGCRGRVYLAEGAIQRAHFRHYPGEGTSACDEYVPGSGTVGGLTSRIPEVLVEDSPEELGLIFEHIEHQLGLLLRLPDVPNDELGIAPLASLSDGFVEVFAGSDRLNA